MVLTPLDLPTELLIHMFDVLDASHDSFQTIVQLSCTCKALRKGLTPYIFRSLKSWNTEKSSQALSLIAKSGYGKHVKAVDFTCALSIKDHQFRAGHTDADFSEDDRLESDRFEDATIVALSSLQHFKKLQEIRLNFQIVGASASCDQPGYEDSWLYWCFCFEDPTDDPQELYAEAEKERSVTLYSKVFELVAQHAGPHVKRLEVSGFLAKPCAAFECEDVHRFFKQIQAFKLGIKGGDNGGGWDMNATWWYQRVMQPVERHVLPQMTALTDLAIVAPASGYLGCTSVSMAPLPFSTNPTVMPKLTSLTLEHVMAGCQLMYLLESHKHSLQSLILHWASVDEAAPDYGASWEGFLDTLADIPMRQLIHFELHPRAELPEKSAVVGIDDTIAAISKAVAEDASKHIFVYTWYDGGHGTTTYGASQTFEAFHDGKDQRAFDRLQEVIRQNRVAAWQ